MKMNLKALARLAAAVLPPGGRCPTCASWDSVSRVYLDGETRAPSPRRCPVCGWRQPVAVVRRYVGVSLEDL